MRRITLLILCVVTGSASSFALTQPCGTSHELPMSGVCNHAPTDLITSKFKNTNPGKLERVILSEENSYAAIHWSGEYDVKAAGQFANIF
jgi:hypothetical protein